MAKQGKAKTVGKCRFCNDPVYSFQKQGKAERNALSHKGCFDFNVENRRSNRL